MFRRYPPGAVKNFIAEFPASFMKIILSYNLSYHTAVFFELSFCDSCRPVWTAEKVSTAALEVVTLLQQCLEASAAETGIGTCFGPLESFMSLSDHSLSHQTHPSIKLSQPLKFKNLRFLS